MNIADANPLRFQFGHSAAAEIPALNLELRRQRLLRPASLDAQFSDLGTDSINRFIQHLIDLFEDAAPSARLVTIGHTVRLRRNGAEQRTRTAYWGFAIHAFCEAKDTPPPPRGGKT